MVKIFDLSAYYGIIRIQGARATDFLQGQLTTDLKTLTPHTHQFSAYCNLKGRIRALLRIWLQDNQYYLQLPKAILPATLNTLQQYGRFSKIEIRDCTHEFFNMGFVFEKPPIKDNEKLLEIAGTPQRFQVIGEQGRPLGTSLEVNIAFQKSYSIPKNFLDQPYEPIDDWKRLNIRAKIPEIEMQTIEQFLPHTLNLPALGAIDFKKGCFCGQEVIARMEYRNPQKRFMLSITTPLFPENLEDQEILHAQENLQGRIVPEAGDKLYASSEASQTIGTIINALCDQDQVEALIEVNSPEVPRSLYLEKTLFKKRFLWNCKSIPSL